MMWYCHKYDFHKKNINIIKILKASHLMLVKKERSQTLKNSKIPQKSNVFLNKKKSQWFGHKTCKPICFKNKYLLINQRKLMYLFFLLSDWLLGGLIHVLYTFSNTSVLRYCHLGAVFVESPVFCHLLCFLRISVLSHIGFGHNKSFVLNIFSFVCKIMLFVKYSFIFY